MEYKDIGHASPVALTPLAVQHLMAVYKRHLALMTPVGLFVPKHHLMAQDASRFFLGIPPGTPLGETKGTTEN